MPDRSTEPAPTRGHKKKERTRRQLIGAAIEVIAERGEAFTASDVVARAGVSNGTFYNYFVDRDELIDAVAPEVLAAFAAEGAVRVDDRDPAARFATITTLGFVRAAEAPEAFRVLLRVDTIQRAVLAGEVIGHLRQDLADGLATGRFDLGPTGADPTADSTADGVGDAVIDAALDVIIGSMLATCRRIVDGLAGPDHPRLVVERLLCSLGLDQTDATEVAARAGVDAAELQRQTREDLSR